MPEASRQPRRCNVPNCDRPHYAKDYCPAHYQNPAFLAPPPYLR